MSTALRITCHGKTIPVVAFFGTKGGVGKTTIARRFAEMVTLAKVHPNVLLVDGDVHHRGMTVEMTSQTPVTCMTVHDYIATQNTSEVEAANLSGLLDESRGPRGELLFIPASAPESARVFDESARIGAEPLLRTLQTVVQSAVDAHDCQCVVIDCGPIIDPYTAASAMLADRAFIIGQNEPISFSSLKSYPQKVREFYPAFSQSKMKVIVNKVRGWEMLEQRKLQEDIFHAIPFSMDIVDVSEGLSTGDAMQRLIFEDHIAQIVEKVFKADHPHLIPPRETMLPEQWHNLVKKADQLGQAPAIRRLGLFRLALPLGVLLAIVGGFLFHAGSTRRHTVEHQVQMAELVTGLKAAIAETAETAATAPLEAALSTAEAVDPANAEAVTSALATARDAGLSQIPAVKRQDAATENTGIGVLIAGLALGLFGYYSAHNRKTLLSAIKQIRTGGVKWLMQEMNTRRSSRRTFDRLLRMTE